MFYVTEVRDSEFKNAFPGIFNFTVGILIGCVIGARSFLRRFRYVTYHIIWFICNDVSIYNEGPPYLLATSSSSRWSFKSEERFFISALWLSISFLTSSIIIFLTFFVLPESFRHAFWTWSLVPENVWVFQSGTLDKISFTSVVLMVKRFLCPCIFQFLIPLSLKLLAYH